MVLPQISRQKFVAAANKPTKKEDQQKNDNIFFDATTIFR